MNFRQYIPNEIQVRMKATHFNFVNKNSLRYTTDAVTNGSESWISPYQKPKLVGHDKTRDPIGRITGYRLVNSDAVDEPPDYVELTAKITDKDAIEKVLDGRYSTVSVGSRSSRVLCSECGQNIIKDGLCEHKKGTYSDEGKRIHWVIDQIDYVESSFVNEPADQYAGVDAVDVGTGWIPYKDFLDNRENILNNLKLEDCFMPDKLTSKAKTNLPDSAFCYVVSAEGKKVRKFPAHDAAHVRNGLATLPQADLPESAKRKIVACYKRRAKRFDVQMDSSNEDISKEMLDFISDVEVTEGLNDEWTHDEIQAIDAFFKENPNFDELQEDEAGTTEDENHDVEPDKLKKDELLDAYKKLQTDYNNSVDSNSAKIKELEDKNSELQTILVEREDEVNKYLDQIAELDKELRDALVLNIVDLKKPDTKEDAEAVSSKYQSRTLESLRDTIADLRFEFNSTTVESEDKVEDPTTHENSDSNQNNTEEKTDDPWAVFSQDNRQVEVI